MMHKIPNCTNVVTQLFGEGQGFANQTSYSLPNSVVESLNVTGFSGFFANSD